eukprot:scaffold124615_cov30-Tisochrysis_lutea.AAC.6
MGRGGRAESCRARQATGASACVHLVSDEPVARLDRVDGRMRLVVMAPVARPLEAAVLERARKGTPLGAARLGVNQRGEVEALFELVRLRAWV